MKNTFTVSGDIPFVQVAKQITEDPSLSWEAKGVLSFLLGADQDEINTRMIQMNGRGGMHKTRRIVHELLDKGILTRKEERKANGQKAGWRYTTCL